MSTAVLNDIVPVRGVADGKGSADPAVRQRWLDQRRGGATATDIRDCTVGSKRRAIINEKVTGEESRAGEQIVRNGKGHTLDFYAEHGNRREPVIAEWIERKFGIAPCEDVYSRGDEPRHMASPDGISLDPFTGALIVGTSDATLAEIKTSTKNLHPGKLDAARVLLEMDSTSEFARKGYYVQMQWQMYVMNAARTLFVWEEHNGEVDPETGTFTPIGVPEYAWIMRDQKLIDILVGDVAPKLLADIDAARLALTAGDLPPVSELPTGHALLVADYFAALDAEATARKAKAKAWDALQAIYLLPDEDGEEKPDTSIDAGFARVTVSTSTTLKPTLNEEGMRKRAPKLIAQYEALVARYTKPVPSDSRKLTITRPKT